MAEIVTKARDVMTKLKNPRTKFQVVNKLDTEEINRLRARYAYIKRKEFLFELLTNYDGSMQNDHEEHRSDWSSSPSLELNEDRPSGTRPVTPTTETDPIDMGDYENRIRPSPNYWYTVDGRNMAEKIIYYRTFGLQSTSELESTLREFRRPTVDPNISELPRDSTQAKNTAGPSQILPGSKSARPQRNIPSAATATRPSSVPPDFVKSSGQLLISHKRPPTADEKRPHSSSTFQNKAFEEHSVSDDRHPTSIDDVHLTDDTTESRNDSNETKNETSTSDNKIQEVFKRKTSETKTQEASKRESSKSIMKVKDNNKKKSSKEKMAAIDENKVISKLDKRIEKDLKALQGIKDDDDDEGDDCLDDAALDEILHGQTNTAIDEFLKNR